MLIQMAMLRRDQARERRTQRMQQVRAGGVITADDRACRGLIGGSVQRRRRDDDRQTRPDR